MGLDTWQVLVGLSVVLVAYVGYVTVLGSSGDVTPVTLLAVVVFGVAGMFLGRFLADRFGSG